MLDKQKILNMPLKLFMIGNIITKIDVGGFNCQSSRKTDCYSAHNYLRNKQKI